MADVSQITYGSNTWDLKDAYARGKMIYPVVGTQTAATATWTGVIDAPALYNGMTIHYYLPYAGVSSTNVTLNLTLSTGSTTGAIPCYYQNNTRLTTHRGAGTMITLTYWTAGSIKVSGTATTDNRWVVEGQYDTNSTDRTIPYCATSASTQAKVVTAYSYFDIKVGDCLPCVFYYANTYNGKITLNVNSSGAKDLYIDGVVSSSSNKTLTRGLHWIYYDGSVWHVRSDGMPPIAFYRTNTTGTLTVAGWSSNTQSVTITGVTATNDIVVSPAPGSAAAWAAAGVVCTAQAANSLTFSCTKTPTAALTVNVMILK